MQLRCRDMEWWMKRRQLPSQLRQRVRRYERQRWFAMCGDDEMEILKDFPEGLWRDIKRFTCLDLIKKVETIYCTPKLETPCNKHARSVDFIFSGAFVPQLGWSHSRQHMRPH